MLHKHLCVGKYPLSTKIPNEMSSQIVIRIVINNKTPCIGPIVRDTILKSSAKRKGIIYVNSSGRHAAQRDPAARPPAHQYVSQTILLCYYWHL